VLLLLNNSVECMLLIMYGNFLLHVVALCDAHFNFFMQEVGLKIRGTLVTTIYRKTLTLSSVELSKFRSAIKDCLLFFLILDYQCDHVLKVKFVTGLEACEQFAVCDQYMLNTQQINTFVPIYDHGWIALFCSSFCYDCSQIRKSVE
jgi:hypothetical protein